MTGTTVMIRRLALVQHALFALLTIVCAARAAVADANGVLLALATAVLAGVYAVGTARIPAAGAAGRPRVGMNAGGWWLLALVACWVGAVAISEEFVWVAFALWNLAGHLLPMRAAVPLSLAMLAVAVAPQLAAGDWALAGILGPTIGGAFALAFGRGLQLIARDSLARKRLVDSLIAAQRETEALHAELAETQRRAGVAAERTRLSREIHDTLAQGFSSILLLARAGAAAGEPERTRHILAQIERSAEDNLDEARRVVADLAPTPLTSGLASALHQIAGRLSEETGIAAEVRVAGDVLALAPATEVALLRVAQSALANVRRHSGASRVVLTLSEAGDSIRLDVVDDGRGFDVARLPQTADRHGGYGLLAARDRLAELGGGLDIETAPGEGTAIGAHLPRRRAQAEDR